MQSTDAGYTVRTLGEEHNNRTEAQVSLLSGYRDDSAAITVSVTPGMHSRISFEAYWQSASCAMSHEELVAVYHAIGAVLDAAGIARRADDEERRLVRRLLEFAWPQIDMQGTIGFFGLGGHDGALAMIDAYDSLCESAGFDRPPPSTGRTLGPQSTT